mmetsp:Transcript_60649/g.135396  ORF Transcript_60649/g.135396 Transcript_60649/m.135396 type:complete len:263 (-) Transcript_60649:115-903(-)
MSTGPIIEELPDDYDVATEKKASSSSSGALRRGFFTSKQPNAGSMAAPSAVPAPGTAFESGRSSPGPAADPPPASGEVPEILEGLRRRLRESVAAMEAERRHASEEAETRRQEEAKSLDSTLSSLQAKWPTSVMKERQAKASKEIDTALAEIRMAFNDARRRRSGDERRALASLKTTAEDAIDRVQKAASTATASRDASEDRTGKTIAAFHTLPLTVKLQILVVEKKASALLLGGAFILGCATVLGICLEVYTAWGCRLECR